MNAYRLNAFLPARQLVQEYNFQFVAEDDDEARRMVDMFYRVCHPITHGPLYRVGKEETRDGIKAVYVSGEPQLIPLGLT